MNVTFTYTLSDSERKRIQDFYLSLDYVALEQFPGWEKVTEDYSTPCYFLAEKDNQIICCARILESRLGFWKTAHIQFGPLFSDPDYLVDSIQEIFNHYKSTGFCRLTIQLGFPTGALADYIEFKLNKHLKICYKFDRHNWSSLFVDLSLSEDLLLKSFSKGHKSAITKSIKEGITVRTAQTLEEVMALCSIYLKMNESRNLSADESKTRKLFTNLFDFFSTNDLGRFLIVRDAEQIIIGGIVLLIQGQAARYFKGASDPDRRNVPILHSALFEAMKIARERGCKIFDLWGYNHFVDENDQVFYINKFKKGFSRNYMFYPKIMYFELNPVKYFLGSTLVRIKRRLIG
jgi:hypothetical protein